MHGTASSPDGIPIAFVVEGAGDPALVFVHGWSCDRTYWREQVATFAERHVVVAIDLAGHGASGIGRASWTMAAFGDDVVAVVDALGLDSVVMVGHSMGGDVIVEAALRLGDRVAGLVWVDVYQSLDEPEDEAALEAFIASFRSDFRGAVRSFVRDRLFRPAADPDLVEQVATDMADAPPEIALDVMWHSMSNERPVVAALSRLAAPVVAINPDMPPTDIESMRRHGIRTVTTTGIGHFPMLEDPPQFNRLLEDAVAGFGRTGSELPR